jgi:hypothetical protein
LTSTRLAVDVLAVYDLFPAQISYATKIRNVREVLGWKLGDEGDPSSWPLLDRRFARGVGSTGPFYTQNQPNGIAYA